MSKLIELDAAIAETWKDTGYSDPLNVMTAIRDRLETLPPVNAVPVVHGRWTTAEGELAFWDMCSECGKKILHRTPYYDFCPNCGADMRKDGEQHDTV